MLGQQMTDLEWPYNLPIWQHSLRLESPNGLMWAEIKNAVEVSMGNPTIGTLTLSSGAMVEKCNPSFIWSDDSMFIAVPQYTSNWLWGIGKQRLLIINVNENRAWQSPKLAYYIQPDTFRNGKVSVTLNPVRKPTTKAYSISEIRDSFAVIPLPFNVR
jgi:hypothetical protein